MARIPAKPKKEKADPTAFILAGRWQGARTFDLRDSECPRAMWLAARWATDRAPPVREPAGLIETVAGPCPTRLGGWPAEWLCPACPQRAVCAGEVEPAHGCRTCRHVTADGRWWCKLHDDEPDLDVQRHGCERWGA